MLNRFFSETLWHLTMHDPQPPNRPQPQKRSAPHTLRSAPHTRNYYYGGGKHQKKSPRASNNSSDDDSDFIDDDDDDDDDKSTATVVVDEESSNNNNSTSSSLIHQRRKMKSKSLLQEQNQNQSSSRRILSSRRQDATNIQDAVDRHRQHLQLQRELEDEDSTTSGSLPPPSNFAVCCVITSIVCVCLLPFLGMPMLVAARRRNYDAIIAPTFDPWPVNLKVQEYFSSSSSSPPVVVDVVGGGTANSKEKKKIDERSAAAEAENRQQQQQEETDRSGSRFHKGALNARPSSSSSSSSTLFGRLASSFGRGGKNAALLRQGIELNNARHVAAVVAIRGSKLPRSLMRSLARAPAHMPLQVVFSLSSFASDAFKRREDLFHAEMIQVISDVSEVALPDDDDDDDDDDETANAAKTDGGGGGGDNNGETENDGDGANDIVARHRQRQQEYADAKMRRKKKTHQRRRFDESPLDDDAPCPRPHSALHKGNYQILFSPAFPTSSSPSSSSSSTFSKDKSKYLSVLYQQGLDKGVSPSVGTVIFLSDSMMPVDPSRFLFQLVVEFDSVRQPPASTNAHEDGDKKMEESDSSSSSSSTTIISALQCSVSRHPFIAADTRVDRLRYKRHLERVWRKYNNADTADDDTSAMRNKRRRQGRRNEASMQRQRRQRQHKPRAGLGAQSSASTPAPAPGGVDPIWNEMWTDTDLRIVDNGWKVGMSSPPGRDSESASAVALFNTWHGFNLRSAGHLPPASASAAPPPHGEEQEEEEEKQNQNKRQTKKGDDGGATTTTPNSNNDDDIVDDDGDLPVLVDAIGSNCIIIDREALHEGGAFAATNQHGSDVDQVAGGEGWLYASMHLSELFLFDVSANFLRALNTVMSQSVAKVTVSKRRMARQCATVGVDAITKFEEISGISASVQSMRWGNSRPWREHYAPDVAKAIAECDETKLMISKALCYCELVKTAAAHVNKQMLGFSSSDLAIPDHAPGWALSLRLRAKNYRVAASRTALSFFVLPQSESSVSLLRVPVWATLFFSHVLPPSIQLATVVHGIFEKDSGWPRFARSLFPEYARVIAAHQQHKNWDHASKVAWSHRHSMLAMWGRRGHSSLISKWQANGSLHFKDHDQHQHVFFQQPASSDKNKNNNVIINGNVNNNNVSLMMMTNENVAVASQWTSGDLVKMPFIHVVWFAICCGCCGFSAEIAHYTRPLSELYPVSVLLGPDCFCPGYESGFADVLGRVHLRPNKYSRLEMYPGEVMIWISHTDPLSFKRSDYFHRRHPSFIVGRSMYEFTRIPPEWEYPLKNNADELWVPSEFVLRAFLDAGIPRQKLRVVPEGIDTRFFDPDLHKPLRISKHDDVTSTTFRRSKNVTWKNFLCNKKPQGRKRPTDQDEDEFVFFSQFKWEPRKGWRHLFEAYFKAFFSSAKNNSMRYSNNDDVSLVVLTTIFYNEVVEKDVVVDIHNASVALVDIQKLVKELYPVDTPKLEELPRFCILADGVSEREMARLFRGADAFVLPTRGEGWGLPTMQAMSMGLPVISTNWGGSVDFTTPDTTFLIEIDKLEEVPRDSPYGYREGKKWATPSVSHLAELMRHVFTEREHAAEVGERAREHIVKHFDDFEVVRVVDRRLQEIAFASKQKTLFAP